MAAASVPPQPESPSPEATTRPKANRVTQPRPEPLYRLLTKCPQEWLILVVRGGELHKIIHAVDGWEVNLEHQFFKLPAGRTREVSALRAASGYEFVGIPPFQGIFVYKFAWNKYWRVRANGAETPQYTVIAHDEDLIYITPFEAQYPLVYGGIDVISQDRAQNADESLIPITLTITVRVRMLQPKVALMTNTDWFGQVLTPNVQKAAKEFAGDKDYNWMIREARRGGSQQFARQFMSAGGGLNQFSRTILTNAGVEITDIGIADVQPNKAFEDALLAQAIAERTARTKIAEAEGLKQAKILEGEAEKAYQKLVGEGNAARIIAEAEANMQRIDKTSIHVAGGAGMTAAMLERWREIHGSGLITYVESGTQSNVGILVGTDGRPISS